MMNATMSKLINASYHLRRMILLVALAATNVGISAELSSAAEEGSLLRGQIISSGGGAVAGVPVKAHREGGTISVAVYSDSEGEYSFPAWSEVTPGNYTLTIQLPDFEAVTRQGVTLSRGETTQADFTLQPKVPSLNDATTTDIILALPGTDDQKVLLAQCSNCHTLQRALLNPHTKEEWAQIIRQMAGERAATTNAPGTRAYGQQRFIEPLAEYLESIRGPGSSDAIPFQLRPRPTDDASTHLVVTEYDIPRGGSWDLFMLRGDRRFVWPHDVVVDDNYAWYTDHYSPVLGRVDIKTGEVKEFTYSLAFGDAEDVPAGQNRAGQRIVGSHDIILDPQGNPVFSMGGMGGNTYRFDTETELFTHWPDGDNMYGMDPLGNVWYSPPAGDLYRLDVNSGQVTNYVIPSNDGIYDMDVDSQGRSILNIWRDGEIGMFDPKSAEYSEFPTPSPGSGPRRGEIDTQDRLWVALYFAGRLGMFDPSAGEVKEFPLVAGTQAYEAPYPAPYSTSVDNRNGFVWTTDFNNGRIYRFDMGTEEVTEYFMPLPYEARDLTVDRTSDRPTLWIPAYRPPAKIVKVQIR